MLDNEPFNYPSRARFASDPGVPNKQLWAIGMVIVQWSLIESYVEMSNRNLIGSDQDLLVEYEKEKNFQSKLVFWKAQLERLDQSPARSHLLGLIPQLQALSSQRDEVVHRTWAGGMEGTSPVAAGLGSVEGGLMPKPGETFKSKSDRIPFAWKLTFIRLRRMAIEMSEINKALFGSVFLPGSPHGYIDTNGQVTGR